MRGRVGVEEGGGGVAEFVALAQLTLLCSDWLPINGIACIDSDGLAAGDLMGTGIIGQAALDHIDWSFLNNRSIVMHVSSRSSGGIQGGEGTSLAFTIMAGPKLRRSRFGILAEARSERQLLQRLQGKPPVL